MEKLSHYYLPISRNKGTKRQKEIIDELFYWAYGRAFGENYLDFPENAISRFT